MKPRAQKLIQDLSLTPHPEGGYFHELFRSQRRVTTEDRKQTRTALTAIYFLLVEEEPNHWHVVQADEIWHFYEGDPLDLHVIDPDTMKQTRTRLGAGPEGGQPVAVVPGGHWQVANTTGEYSLVGCTVGPGFELEDFLMLREDRESTARLRSAFPDMARFL